ncbi:MAG TPA: hypothetical protein PLD58_22985, partial [Phycisphaerae bacterium]|nr:hypothetical protein [Phycisphaerae bacterium]
RVGRAEIDAENDVGVRHGYSLLVVGSQPMSFACPLLTVRYRFLADRFQLSVTDCCLPPVR